MHQCKTDSQESLRVIVENEMNVYQQHDCQTSKANADQVTKMNLFLSGEKVKKGYANLYKYSSTSRVST